MALKVLAVCGMGVGTSLLLKIKMEKIFQDLGLDAELDITDIGIANTYDFDVCVTTTSFYSTLRRNVGENDRRYDCIIEMVNVMDDVLLREKISELCKRKGYLPE